MERGAVDVVGEGHWQLVGTLGSQKRLFHFVLDHAFLLVPDATVGPISEVHELIVLALFGHEAVLQDNDLVTVLDSRQTMSYDDGRHSIRHLFDSLL